MQQEHQLIEKLEREWNLLKEHKHENIVKYLDHFIGQYQYYLVTDFYKVSFKKFKSIYNIHKYGINKGWITS
jgi:serine/threonine protein kinase